MGCDIHFYVERLVDGKWEQQVLSNAKDHDGRPAWEAKYWFHDRNYRLFAHLADVRNYAGIQPISKPRGLPTDLSDGLKNEWEYWAGDGHSMSHYTLNELLEARNKDIVYRVAVDYKGYKNFKETGEIQGIPVGDAQPHQQIISNEEMERVLALKVFLNDGDAHLTEIVWKKPVVEISPNFWNATLDKMMALDSNPENVRCVFWFDN